MSTTTSRGKSTEIEVRRLEKLADEIDQEVKLAEARYQEALGHAITAGTKLIEAKGLVEHGKWTPWLEEHFSGSQRTASRYMQLARNSATVANLGSVREAVAMLAQPKPKPEAVPFWTDADDAEELAAACAHNVRDFMVGFLGAQRESIKASGKVSYRRIEMLADGEAALAGLETAFGLTGVPPQTADERRENHALLDGCSK